MTAGLQIRLEREMKLINLGQDNEQLDEIVANELNVKQVIHTFEGDGKSFGVMWDNTKKQHYLVEIN